MITYEILSAINAIFHFLLKMKMKVNYSFTIRSVMATIFADVKLPPLAVI